MPPPPTAASLFRDVGLLADGPLPWGRPVPARGPGVFVVELTAPLGTAPIELTRIGKWLEHVPALRLDGERPSSRALAARLAAFWLPSQTILYVGATRTSLGPRIAAIDGTVLGERRPHSGGHWLQVLTALPRTRVWWAATEAVEEYEDALLSAFAAGVDPDELARLPDREVVLPFANLRRPTGERRATGITGELLPDPAGPPPPPTRVVVVPDGDAEGARGEPPERRRRVGSSAVPAKAAKPASGPGGRAVGSAGGGSAASGSGASGAAGRTGNGAGAANLTAEGAARIQAELDELIRVRRPDVIARIRSAKELGDLKENADYTSAREEQSFLEGRIQALEAQLRSAVIATVPAAGAGADLGSVVTVQEDGLTSTYTLVGSAEANAGAGRLSVASPVGKALLGARPGDQVTVQTPRGSVVYEVVTVE